MEAHHMNKKDFCCVDDFPVLVPYKTLEIMVEVATNFDRYQKDLRRTNEQLTALRRQYSELSEKVREIDKNI